MTEEKYEQEIITYLILKLNCLLDIGKMTKGKNVTLQYHRRHPLLYDTDSLFLS